MNLVQAILKNLNESEEYNVYTMESNGYQYVSKFVCTVDSKEQAEDKVAELRAENGVGAWYEEKNKKNRGLKENHRILREGRSSSDLKQEIIDMGGDPTGMSVKQMQEELFKLHWEKDHPGEPIPDQYDPMLAHEIKSKDPDEIRNKYTSDKYIAQQKYDGLRSITSIHPDGSYSINTRGRSVKNFAFPDHSGKILGFEGMKSPFKGKVVLDGEMLAPSNQITSHTGVTSASSLQAINSIMHSKKDDSLELQRKYGSVHIVYYDILYYDGEDVQSMPYDEREQLVVACVKALQEANGNKLPIEAAPTVRDFDDIWELFQEHIKRGDEGIMVKRKDMKYQQGYRSHDMLKLKGKTTIDAFITGWVPSTEGKSNENYIGGFQFSANVDGKPRVIASVSNISDAIRKDATVYDDNGKPTLNPDYLNRCAALTGQEFGKNNLLGSARIQEWREDKTPEECNLTAEDIKPKGR